MQTRRLFGLFLTTLGLALFATSVSAAVFHCNLRIGSGVIAAISILFLALGAIVLIMDIFEIWLSRGQAALVDGLQAG